MAETMRNHRLKSGCTLVPRQTQLSHSSGWGDSWGDLCGIIPNFECLIFYFY